jgi:hypothetical protein
MQSSHRAVAGWCRSFDLALTGLDAVYYAVGDLAHLLSMVFADLLASDTASASTLTSGVRT